MILLVSDWDRLSREEKLAFWRESERLLSDLLEASRPYLAEPQHEMAQELIDHNEHLLALELLFDYLEDKAADYPQQLLDKFRVLDARLVLSEERDVNRLGATAGPPAPA